MVLDYDLTIFVYVKIHYALSYTVEDNSLDEIDLFSNVEIKIFFFSMFWN